MIMLINICKEELHAFEFVEPVKSLVKSLELDFFEKKYQEVSKHDLAKADKIIICGTSLKDNFFAEKKNLKFFEWIKDFDKPVLGICGGMQIMGLLFGGKIKQKTEIGFFKETFKKEFLGLRGENEVWHLHNNFVDFSKLSDFEIFCSSKNVQQAVKHNKKSIYGVLFHPEVRNKNLIINFLEYG